jgi:hypothetical protein
LEKSHNQTKKEDIEEFFTFLKNLQSIQAARGSTKDRIT